MPTAILVDGGYFVKRYRALMPPSRWYDASTVVRDLFRWALLHLDDRDYGQRQLYRIFFYDCPPSLKRRHHPLTNRPIDYAKTTEATFRTAMHSELLAQRKVALRLGRLATEGAWTIRPEPTLDLLAGRALPTELKESDVVYDLRQKGVDMRIGIDIASLAYKRQVDQIVLIAGDSDFVPAAKLARREGIDFILDPMWQPVPADLFEHIDGLRSTCPRRQPKATTATAHS
jgi:uncharacterized LabA/DUF88 family protein